MQYLTYLNPLRYLIEIVRGIFLKGTRRLGAVAADAGAADFWRVDADTQHVAVPEAVGLIIDDAAKTTPYGRGSETGSRAATKGSCVTPHSSNGSLG